MNYKEQISVFIDNHKSEMVAFLQELAKIPSVLSKAEENMPYGKAIDDALRLALDKARSLGLDAECQKNKADFINVSAKQTKLAILAHLDVVPADSDGWKTLPFEPTIVGNMIYGRGVSDNKGPAVAALYALYAIKSLGIDLKHNVMLYLGGCEENGQDDLKDYINTHKMPPYCFTPDGCFPVGNAERGRIVITCNTDFASDKIISVNSGKGVNIIPDYAEAQLTDSKVEIFGKSTHAAHPKAGENALTALLEKLYKVDEVIKKLSNNFPHGVFNGSGLGLDGGLDISLTQLKIENGKMFFTADGRVNLGVNAKALAKTIQKNISFPIQMRVDEPHFVPADSDIVQKLNKVYEKHTPRKGSTYTLDAMTYAHHIDGAVIFGGVLPGDGCANAHSANECYNLNTLTESAKIFADAIIEICEIEGE